MAEWQKVQFFVAIFCHMRYIGGVRCGFAPFL